MAQPSQRDVVLREAQRLAGGDAQLLAHEVEAGDQLRDRVLDLQARVDLDEVEVAVAVEQELDRAGVLVAGLARDRDGRRAQALRAAPASTAGEGDSSTSFWLRRWIEHSRSPRWTTLP